MQFWDSLAGKVKCKVISASLEQTINRISSCCEVTCLQIVDDLTATFWIRRRDLHLVRCTDDQITVIKQSGIYWKIMRLKKRPVLVIGVLAILFLVFYLPTLVLFINVKGNVSVPSSLILDSAEKCGVVFCASRKSVRSERVKNELLQSIPQLQWACINTKGCVAEITVQERTTSSSNETQFIDNIVANRDGIITGITVYKGAPQCQIGQVVKKGQLLVSGYLDFGLVIKRIGAEAEVTAETIRSINAVALPNYIVKNRRRGVSSTYSLQIGKKLINFSKDSGISPPGCGRINKIYNLTLPGGYRLPVAFIDRQTIYYDKIDSVVNDADSFDWLWESADKTIKDQMVAGRIIKRTATIQNDGKLCRLIAHYRCDEMIATAQKKETDVIHGKRS